MLQQVTKLQLHQVAIWASMNQSHLYRSTNNSNRGAASCIIACVGMHHSHLPLTLLLARQHHCMVLARQEQGQVAVMRHLARHLARLAHLLPLVLHLLEGCPKRPILYWKQWE